MGAMLNTRHLAMAAALALAAPAPRYGIGAEAPASTNSPTKMELDPITVSARGRGINPDLLPGSVGIAAPGSPGGGTVGAAGITATIPGASVVSDGPWTSDVNIRGLARDSVVVTIDDCRVNTATARESPSMA